MHLRRLRPLPCPLALAALAVGLALCSLAPGARSQADQSMPNPPVYPFENEPLPGQEVLGKLLFWDEQLSSDNTMACGTCHRHESGGSDPRAFDAASLHPGPDGVLGTEDDIRGSQGVIHQARSGAYVAGDAFFPGAGVTPRKAPSVINAVYFNDLFWDGRASHAFTDPQTGLPAIGFLGALESQASDPPVSDVEMAHEGLTWDDVAAKLEHVKPMALASNMPPDMADFLAAYPGYPEMFAAVYGDEVITSQRILFAIANYERTLISDATPLDALLKGQVTQLAPDLQPGFTLFLTKAKCTSCHVLPFTTDSDYHNLGVRPDAEDVGRMAVTGNPADIARFKTPNIRNSALRLPLFHNGSIDTLEELVDFYDVGGLFKGPNTDSNLLALGLTPEEKADLVHFLDVGLTDPRVAAGEFPFTRPTLHSELPPSNLIFGTASANGAGVLPVLIATVPANLGHPGWKLGVHAATPNAPAILALASAAGSGAPFADPRFPVPMNIQAGALLTLLPAVTDGSGVATAQLGIPLNAALSGFVVYAQYFIKDAAALATGGVYGSQGVAVTLF